MLFNSKSYRLKTPPKTISSKSNTQKSSKREETKGAIKYRTKEAFRILQGLEEIYQNLSFNEYEVFPIEEIHKARQNIEELSRSLTELPTCRYHGALLTLYCESEKEILCVKCVYGPEPKHKTHKIKALDAVEKNIEYERVRNEERSKALADQLRGLHEEVEEMQKEMGEAFSVILDYTNTIIEESIRELITLKADMSRKLDVSYQRTLVVLERYGGALDAMINHIDHNLQKSYSLSDLSKHLLLRELTHEAPIIEALVDKFYEQKSIMEQWRKSKTEFNKIVLKKRNEITTKVDSYVVTEF